MTEELLLELLIGFLSERLPSPLLSWDVHGVAFDLDFSARGLVGAKSLQEPLSASFFLQEMEFLSATKELFLAVGDGDAEDCGVEVSDGLTFVPPDTGDT